MKISVIIPTYNEKDEIKDCLLSLTKQIRTFETIVVDDGSTDITLKTIKQLKNKLAKLKVLGQKHRGPGAARNLGAKVATGDILVFVDADMTFTPDFINTLVKPIEQGLSKGTFSQEEYVSNWNNIWARCWNYNLGLEGRRLIPTDQGNQAKVFRAILKSEFDRIGGFDEGIGWIDDWSLHQKLGYKSTSTKAKYYHQNPQNLYQVFIQARWIGKSKLYSKNIAYILLNTFRFSWVMGIISGLAKSWQYQTPRFLVFKVIYNTGVTVGLLSSLIGSHKNK